MALFKQKTVAEKVADALGLFVDVKVQLMDAIDAGNKEKGRINEEILLLTEEYNAVNDAMQQAQTCHASISAFLEGRKVGE